MGQVDLALGDSEFNRQELEQMGFAPTGVMPIAVNIERITNAPRRPALEKILGDGLSNILFVGRIAPNKRIEDHIRLAETYKRHVDSYYRFIFVGRCDGLPTYYAQVWALIAEFRMLPDRFWFTGPVPDEDLAAFYRWADVYVSLSEHEGFCVPLNRGTAPPAGGFRAGSNRTETVGHRWRVGRVICLVAASEPWVRTSSNRRSEDQKIRNSDVLKRASPDLLASCKNAR